jgi:hypothetical protein
MEWLAQNPRLVRESVHLERPALSRPEQQLPKLGVNGALAFA